MRVRLFEKRRGGMFFREVWIPGKGRDQASLGTRDRQEAERLGRALLGELLRGTTPSLGPIRLADLWARFERECPAYLDNKPRTKADARQRVRYRLRYFGADRDVRRLTAVDQYQYAEARRAGAIRLPGTNAVRAVRARRVDADLYLLHQMLGWACTVPTAGSGRWLERNPLAGIRREREKNPRRPVATWERFVATRGAMQQLGAAARNAAERRRWLRIELALVLAEATGRRLGSIRLLRWEDIDWERGTIRWRSEADKKGVEWVIPTPAQLQGELRSFRVRLEALGGFLFPAEKNGEVPMDRHLFDKWLALAEATAGLPKLEGSLWHAYRRKWASERKHHPLPDVAAAGGWKDLTTLLECYQAPDDAAVLAVMGEPRKRHDQRAAEQTATR